MGVGRARYEQHEGGKMGFIWYWIVLGMLAAYVVLDGFDLGAGALYPLLGRTEQERTTIILSIGPVWDGNEVWLIAAGGTLLFAFPLLYASSLSGFYLPLIMILWLLIVRGIGIELRGHLDNQVWRTFFGALFTIASVLLAAFLGTALANVIRGVPLGPSRYFFLPLWTNFQVGPNPGIFDWYTIICGLISLIALTVHGALWIVLKSSGKLSQRARLAAILGWAPLCLLSIAGLVATPVVQPLTAGNYESYPVLFLIPAIVIVSLFSILIFSLVRRPRVAFAASCLYLVFMLIGAGAGLYPRLLPSSANPADGITVSEALTGSYGQHIGLIWWVVGILLAIGYFITMYWMFRGKAEEQTQL